MRFCTVWLVRCMLITLWPLPVPCTAGEGSTVWQSRACLTLAAQGSPTRHSACLALQDKGENGDVNMAVQRATVKSEPAGEQMVLGFTD